MARANRYPGTCYYCNGHVAKNAGVIFEKKYARGFHVAHLACHDAGAPQVVTAYFPSTGQSMSVNARGRCEDAPCCGCCT